MKVDHVRFAVDDAQASRDWFVQRLGFRSVTSSETHDSQIEVVNAGSIYFVLCAGLTAASPVTQFLRQHPPGVSDLAFSVPDLEATIAQAMHNGATLLQPMQTEPQPAGCLKWATIAAWGDLTHTFVERSGTTPLIPRTTPATAPISPSLRPPFTGIDHIVLNLARGALQPAVRWYEKVLGFQRQQKFEIQTDYSALCSQVMRHPAGFVQLPINEPASPNSQIQEFLDCNRGPGVQHIALETVDLVNTIAHLRHSGLPLLQVPASYYTQLRQRPGLPLSAVTLDAIASQHLLVDWQDAANPAVLLQTFTQPIFEQPTFFFELIERQVCTAQGQTCRAQGFGEGNFRALFEAIEREQIKRGSLRPDSR